MSTYRTADEDILSQSSDDKMDTGSESFKSQDTPNSIVFSDCEDRSPENILRLRNPEFDIEAPEPEGNSNVKLQNQLTDSFVSKMSNLHLDSPLCRPRNLGISPPKFMSSLVLTTNHPLMNLGSPDDYPDLIPKTKIKEEDKESQLSVEDVRASETNGYGIYSPEINTSKNNLYFSELFTTADSQVDVKDNSRPDVAKVDQKARRKIVAKLVEKTKELEVTPHKVSNFNESTISREFENMRASHKSTPKSVAVAVPSSPSSEYRCEVAEWCESPSHLRSMPNFELPIELSANITSNHELESPDVVSSSTQDDKSAYQALLDPYTGSVVLRHTAAARATPDRQRRRIQLPPEEDAASLDSVSVSLDSEDEPPELEEVEPQQNGDEEIKSPSKSSHTVSECSDPIPEYSAAEELNDERSWLAVHSGKTVTNCDMKVIEPFKRVLSHGGYDGAGAAIIVFSACHLPDNARTDYRYVMDNLFLYVIWTLERLVVDEYVLVYLHGSAGRRRLPGCRWLHECYKLVDRRLRKSLKHLYLVHPTFWVKSFVLLAKTFVSSKFFRKLTYVSSIRELFSLVPVEPNAIPEAVRKFDSSGGRYHTMK